MEGEVPMAHLIARVSGDGRVMRLFRCVFSTHVRYLVELQKSVGIMS